MNEVNKDEGEVKETMRITREDQENKKTNRARDSTTTKEEAGGWGVVLLRGS